MQGVSDVAKKMIQSAFSKEEMKILDERSEGEWHQVSACADGQDMLGFVEHYQNEEGMKKLCQKVRLICDLVILLEKVYYETFSYSEVRDSLDIFLQRMLDLSDHPQTLTDKEIEQRVKGAVDSFGKEIEKLKIKMQANLSDARRITLKKIAINAALVLGGICLGVLFGAVAPFYGPYFLYKYARYRRYTWPETLLSIGAGFFAGVLAAPFMPILTPALLAKEKYEKWTSIKKRFSNATERLSSLVDSLPMLETGLTEQCQKYHALMAGEAEASREIKMRCDENHWNYARLQFVISGGDGKCPAGEELPLSIQTASQVLDSQTLSKGTAGFLRERLRELKETPFRVCPPVPSQAGFPVASLELGGLFSREDESKAVGGEVSGKVVKRPHRGRRV